MIENINHTQISNQFIDKYLNQLNGSEVKIFLAISRKTIGWHKETDKISLSQLQKITGMGREAVNKAINILESKELILVVRYKNRTNEYEINYKVVRKSNQMVVRKSNQMVVRKSNQGSSKIEPNGSSKIEHTKDTIKETKQKKAFIPPTIQEVKQYFKENGYREDIAEKAYKYYAAGDWINSEGKPVRNWKQTMVGVWMKPENREIKKEIPVLLQWQVDELKDRSWRFKKPEPIEGKDYILKVAI